MTPFVNQCPVMLRWTLLVFTRMPGSILKRLWDINMGRKGFWGELDRRIIEISNLGFIYKTYPKLSEQHDL